MKRFVPYLVLLFGVLYLASSLRPKEPRTEFDLKEFSLLPVLANGRIKPLDTVARTSLLTLQARQRVIAPDDTELSTTEWLLDVLFRAEAADTYRTIAIDNLEVLSLIGQDEESIKRTYTGAKRVMAILGFLPSTHRRFAFEQIEPYLSELDSQARLADAVEAPARDAFQRAVVKLRNNLYLYQQLKHSVVLPGDTQFLSRLQRLQDEMVVGVAAVRARAGGQEHDEALAERVMEAGMMFQRMEQVAYLLPIPPLDGSQNDADWQSTGQALLGSFQDGLVNPYALTYAALADAWRNQNAEQFNTLVRLYQEDLNAKFGPQVAKAEAEATFNRAEPFYAALKLYVLAFLIAIVSWLRWPDILQRSANWLLLLAFVATTVGLAVRMWLEGRPPVTNLYSSALFVGWGAVGLCLVLERIYRNGIGSTAGGLIGFCTLLIAHHLSLSGDTLEMMRAVLDSNFWLATHVIIITIGYSATFLAGFLAMIYILRGVLTKSLDRQTSDALSRMVYGIVCFATLFSLVGTILGGIWADQSWGRFWGWDPKENGALLIVLWNAVVLHARWGGLARTRGIMALAVFGNIVTSWSWFGTNMLGVGLHSYGFMDEAFKALVAFVVSQLALIALAYVPSTKWRSRDALARKSPAVTPA